MVFLSIEVAADVLEQGDVSVAMYGTVNGVWSYFDGTGYEPICSSVPPPIPVTSVPPFITLTSHDRHPYRKHVHELPADTTISYGGIIFGVGGLPTIVNGCAATEPDPVGISTVYDVVEFGYTAANGTSPSNAFMNTTAVNQFGLPIRIDISPASVGLPHGAGVTLDRTGVLSRFNALVAGGDFAQCTQDLLGNPVTQRIMSPYYALQSSCVAGVVANDLPNTTTTLAPGTYYYAVTAVGPNGSPESYAQFNVAQYVVPQAQPGSSNVAVNVAWANLQPWQNSIGGYNVYRGTASGSSVAWGMIAQNLSSDTYALPGGDTGLPLLNDDAPPLNPLNTFFDGIVQTVFTTYTSAQPLTLQASSVMTGTTDNYFYSFNGASGTDGEGNAVLQFTLESVVDAGGNTVTSPPVPLQTQFNVYNPFWNTNTYTPTNPAPPALYADNPDYVSWVAVPPSVMVFGCANVFADNAVQSAPSGADPATFSNLLGSLENQVVSAIVRGVATSTTIAPSNWGNATGPVVTSLVATGLPAGQTQSTLVAGQRYHYVVTAVNNAGETICSLEFSAKPTQDDPCLQVSWNAMNLSQPGSQIPNQAASFNIYRGTSSQQEILVASVANAATPVTSFTDCGASLSGSPVYPPTYYPAGGTWPQYDAFFHQPSVSIAGAAYAFQYDDQGNQSPSVSTDNPVTMSIKVGRWNPRG
jgi:hypothetical protein